MEGSAPTDAADRLSAFLDRVTDFLGAVAETPSIGTGSERLALSRANSELQELQIARAKQHLRERSRNEFEEAGFSLAQMEFKLAVAERAMTETAEVGPAGWMAPSAVLRAVGKLKVILSSIKSLSKWLEAVDELVGMTGELAKNRLGPKLD